MLEPGTTQHETGAADADNGGGGSFSAHFTGAFRILWLVAAGIVGNRTLADDVVQEAAIIGLNKFAAYQPGTNFTAWMLQIVRHVAQNTMRKERRHQGGILGGQPDRGVPVVGPAGAGPAARSNGDSGELVLGKRGELPANQREFDDQVLRALSEISPAARACLLLRSIEGLDYREISKLLGLPAGTAMSHVHRSRRFLRERLGGSAGGPPNNGRTNDKRPTRDHG